MTAARVLISTGLLALGVAGCSWQTAGPGTVVPPGANTVQYKNATEAAHSDLSYIPPCDPRYAENGAPRAGEVTGATIAGDPRLIGECMSYAPIYHNRRWVKGP